MKRKISKKDIAIIGVSGTFPGSENVREFWGNLKEGKELIHFYSKEEIAKMEISEEQKNNPNYVFADSLIEDSAQFDHKFFDYLSREAALMDPQIRKGFEQTWLALEDAGYSPKKYKGKIGLYIGASDNLNWRIYTQLAGDKTVNPFLLKQLSDKNQMATLIAYKLNLTGPAMNINTSCSSSLVALHTACRSLLFRECDMALAAGISIRTDQEIGYAFEEGMINSSDGHCKPFDKGATGTLRGEGAAVVVLKRLESALEDGDHVYAVIKASSSNNDGNTKVGYTAPSVDGQAKCIRHAYRVAGIDPSEVSYVEAHGTGTRLGDPIEVAALNKVFGKASEKKCLLGSVKSNIGHLDAGAGIAGLIKTALALKYKQIPESLHYTTPNPEIPFEQGNFEVNKELKNWTVQNDEARIAGVSSFGIGGTNVHVVLQDMKEELEKTEDSDSGFKIIPISAKSDYSLNQYRKNLLQFVQEEYTSLTDLAYTFQTGREVFEKRAFVIADSRQELIEQLKVDSFYTGIADQNKGLCFMFPGQGSQYQNMGIQLFQNVEFYKNILNEGLEELAKQTGKDFRQILFGSDAPETINQTNFTQPILFLMEYALAKTLIEFGIVPEIMIGHSLGEYAAACVANVFSFEDALRLVVKRGNLISKLEEGRMLAIAAPQKSVIPYLFEGLNIAAENSPSTCVVSGNNKAIEEFIEKLSVAEIPYRELKTSHAFHSIMMDEILDEFSAELEKVTLNEPQIPFVSGVTGKTITNVEAMSKKYWVQQVRETVKFSEGISMLLQNHQLNYLEVGPGNTLLKFTKDHLSKEDQSIVLSSIPHPKEKKNDCQSFFTTVAKLWSNGYTVNWNKISPRSAKRVSAPKYPFEKIVFPVKVNPLEYAALDSSRIGVEVEERSPETKSNKPLKSHNYNPLEQELLNLWQSFFDAENLSVNDDFFELGGDSLKAVTMANRIYDLYKIRLKPEDYFNYTTVKLLAGEIQKIKNVLEMKEEVTEKEDINEIII